VGTTFDRLKSGDFNYGIDLHDGNAPEEIMSFARSYNQTIETLGSSKVELENTLRKLEDANRELIENQEAIVEAKKFTAMRLLASEIAHEINNPLSSLTTFLGICCEEVPADDQKKEILDLMLKEVNRCRSILRELVEFAKKEPLKIKAVNPASLLKDAIKVVLKQHEKSAVNLTAFCSELPREVLLDPVLIHQALVNILNNAYQFTKPGGSIDIEGYVDCDSMVIEIKDSGTGISEENLPYVFEPFFSTRKEMGGSGLGLAITKKIIERHNGSIRVESKVEKETVFTIRLPMVNTLT
jgi:signal transduction histidine kinase